MAIFDTADRQRIVDALSLAEELNRPSSILASLMTTRETDDTSYGVDRVTDIKNALDDLESLQENLSEPANSAVRRENFEGKYEVEYAVSDTQQGYKRQKTRHINNIKKWLDPDQRLEPYVLSGRVIRTL